MAGLDSMTLDYLWACHELVLRQQELVPLLAARLSIPIEELYYAWVMGEVEQIGLFANNEWSYFFHGLECDLTHRTDERMARVDFGPRGRVDTFTDFGVLQFTMACRPPWRVSAGLQVYLSKPPPYDPLSGSVERAGALMDCLEQQRLVEIAGP